LSRTSQTPVSHFRDLGALGGPRLDRRERTAWVRQPWVEQLHLDVDPTHAISLKAFTRESRIAQVGESLEEVGGWGAESPTRGRKPKW